MPRVAVVTDSAANLVAREIDDLDISVVQLQIVVAGRSRDESDVSPAELASALSARVQVSTSRPAPPAFVAAYEAAAAAGADEVVSIHLSGQMSGTVQAAQMAARQTTIPVTVVDSGLVGLTLGFCVLTAARAAAEGASAAEVKQAALAAAGRSSTYFYVDTLEHLRRGGRIGTAQAMVGTALSVKPLLQVSGGRIVPVDKVRTASKALARLQDLCLTAADDELCDVAVQHLACHARAATFAASVGRELAARGVPTTPIVREVGAVLGAHVGPGMLAVAVVRR